MRFVVKTVRAAAPACNYDEFYELCESARRILERSDLLITAVPAKAADSQPRAAAKALRMDRKRASLIELLSAVCVT